MLDWTRFKTWIGSHRRATLVVAVVVIAGATLAGLALGRRSSVQYFTATAERGDIVATVQATGTINAVTTVQVGSQVSGQISAINADFNSRVRKGELVAQIDSAPFQARLLQAEADLASAEAGVKGFQADLAVAGANLEKMRAALREAELNRKRTLELHEQGIASEQQRDAVQVAHETAVANLQSAEAQINQTKARIEQARAQVKQSQARLEQSRLDLRNTYIHAPIDGTVIARSVDVGQTVAASLQAPTLFTIAQDLTKMLVYAKTDESDVGRIRVGVDASFKVDSFPQVTFSGRVTQVRMNAYQVQNVVTYDTIIEFENPDVKLLPGMTAYVTIPVATARDVIKIPNGALRFKPEMPDEQRRALLAKYGLLGPAASPGGDGAGTVRAQERSGGDNAGPGAGQGGGQGGGGQGGNEEERARRRERFQQMSPEERAQARAHRQGMREGGGGGGQSFQGPGVESASQILWKLLPNNTLQPVRVKTGVTDFTVTAMLEGDIQPGDKFVIGQTMSGRASSSPVGGMPRRF